jgi:uncharacterized protein
MCEGTTDRSPKPKTGPDHTRPPVQGATDGAVRETHISILAFVGDRVYKLRKRVHFDFLDLRSRENREADCLREVQLNGRLAPDVYLGVADVVMDGELIDHMVVMRALPEERQLAQLVRGGSEVDAPLDAIARTLATFHSTALRSTEISAGATPDALRSKWTGNFDEMQPFVGTVVDRRVDDEIRSLVDRWIDSHSDLLSDRIAGGHVCDGHGDLQASDIFCLESGVRVLDCLQFSDWLRYDDVCGDVGFLAMDLERLGHADAARCFVQAYEHHSGAPLPRSLLNFHVALRAYIRAKVACMRAEQGSETAAEAARQLHALARRHLLCAHRAVVLVGGLPGSGKTTLARALGEELGWAVLSSDVVRRDLAPGVDRYTPQAMAAVYEELFRQARGHLRRGTSVILDASWINADERAQAAQVGTQMQAELVELECACAGNIAAERLRHRLERHDDDSEASLSVRTMMATQMDPWPTAVPLDTTGGTTEAVERALSAMASRSDSGSRNNG